MRQRNSFEIDCLLGCAEIEWEKGEFGEFGTLPGRTGIIVH